MQLSVCLSVPSIRGKPLQFIKGSIVCSYFSSFSPLHSGQATAIAYDIHSNSVLSYFQSPPFGASHCNGVVRLLEAIRNALSVPSIRGKPLQSDCLVSTSFSERSFSPLHSGQATAMPLCQNAPTMLSTASFSPLHSGQATAIK